MLCKMLQYSMWEWLSSRHLAKFELFAIASQHLLAVLMSRRQWQPHAKLLYHTSPPSLSTRNVDKLLVVVSDLCFVRLKQASCPLVHVYGLPPPVCRMHDMPLICAAPVAGAARRLSDL